MNKHHMLKRHALSLMHPIIQHPRRLKLLHGQGYSASCQSLHKKCHRRTDLHQELSDELLGMSHKGVFSAFWTWFGIESTKTFIANNGSAAVSDEGLVSQLKTDDAVTLWPLLPGISLFHTNYYKQAQPNQEKIYRYMDTILKILPIVIMRGKKCGILQGKRHTSYNNTQTPFMYALIIVLHSLYPNISIVIFGISSCYTHISHLPK